jgi:hypothetical protein
MADCGAVSFFVGAASAAKSLGKSFATEVAPTNAGIMESSEPRMKKPDLPAGLRLVL